MNLGFGWWHLPFAVNWGDSPSYFTGASLIIATLTLAGSRADRRRAQAELVSAWVLLSGEEGNELPRIRVRNASSAAVTRIRLAVEVESEQPRIRWMTDGRPETPVVTDFQDVRYLGPDSSFHRDYERAITWGGLRFVDASGREWMRTARGVRRVRRLESKIRYLWGK